MTEINLNDYEIEVSRDMYEGASIGPIRDFIPSEDWYVTVKGEGLPDGGFWFGPVAATELVPAITKEIERRARQETQKQD